MNTTYPGTAGIIGSKALIGGSEGQEDLTYIDAVAKLLENVAQPGTVEDKCNKVLAELISATGADSASLRIRDEPSGTIREITKMQRTGVGCQIISGNHAGSSDIRYSPWDIRSIVGSEATRPVKAGGQCVGKVTLKSGKEDHFTSDTIRFLGMTCDVVGLMWQQANISRRLQASLNELSVLDEVARIITSAVAIDEVYERFALELQKLVQFDRVSVNIVDLVRHTYTIRYVFGQGVAGSKVGDGGPLKGSVTGRVVESGRSLTGEDTSAAVESAAGRRFLEAGLVSCIMLPLVSKGSVIGTLSLRSRNAGAYGEREREILERLAGHIAPAVESAGLQEAMRLAEIEERRRSLEMESLINVANILRGPGAFIDKCTNALECFTASPGVETATLRVPVGGPIGDIEGMRLVAQTGGTLAPAALVLTPDSLSCIAFRGSQPLVINDCQENPATGERTKMGSIIFLPIKTESGRGIGLVNVASHERNYFTPEIIRYFAALADGIGTLLENAGLRQQIISELEQRQKTEEALHETESRLLALAQNTGDIMWELDNSGCYTFCSPNIRSVTGYEASDVIGKSLFDFMTMSESARMREVFGELAHNRAPFSLIEHTVDHRDGRRFVLECSGAPIFDVDGAFAGFRGVDRDVSQRKATEERSQKESQLSSLGELASEIAHELNNPLAAVMTFAHLLKSQELPGGVGEDVETIYTEAQRAAKVVQNLLAFARRHEPEKSYGDVVGAVSRALSLKGRDLSANKIEVRTNYESGLPKTMVDEHQLTQVFLNIVTNAEQTMAEKNGGGTLWIRGWKEGTKLRFSFRDDGPGISRENMEKIFDPFFTTKKEGNGLGLSMCYRMVRAHGGRIWVESPEGEGTTFYVELPIEKPEGTEWEGEDIEKVGKIRGKWILVVDDEQVFTDPLCRILSREGHVVEVARDGEEAWQAIGRKRYACILMDVRMPGVGGKELYRRIKEQDEGLAKRVIFATGDTLNPETQEFLENTGNAWLGKPFTVEELESRIQECLSQEAG